MSEGLEVAIRTALIGIGATATLDLWAEFQQRVFGVPATNWGLVGRWFGHFPKGQFIHDNVASASPVRGELIIGWVSHYVIGIVYALVLVAIWGIEWARQPTLLPALIVAVVMLIAPFFVMQPGMGAGIAASRTPNPNGARLKSLINHSVFGVGLYLAALVSVLVIQPEI